MTTLTRKEAATKQLEELIRGISIQDTLASLPECFVEDDMGIVEFDLDGFNPVVGDEISAKIIFRGADQRCLEVSARPAARFASERDIYYSCIELRDTEWVAHVELDRETGILRVELNDDDLTEEKNIEITLL